MPSTKKQLLKEKKARQAKQLEVRPEIKERIEDSTELHFSSPDEKRQQLELLLKEIENRKNQYSIIDTKLDRIPAQQKLLDDVRKRLDDAIKPRFFLYYGGNGAGKCHRFEDKVLAFDGKWIKAWEVNVGDKLMGPDSKVRNVINAFSWEGEMFKIEVESGEPIYVNGFHKLMLIFRRRNRKWERKELQESFSHLEGIVPEGELVEISVYDYLKKSTKWKAEAYMWRPSIISYDEKVLSIDPYFLGAWLGDGTTSSPSITNIDSEVNDYVANYAESIWLDIRKYWITSHIKKKGKQNRYGASWYSLLREIWVLNNKHIPLDYLTSSETQRLELLAWLLDTDWEAVYWENRTPRFSITQKSEKLARNILQLARSLGFRCNIVTTIKTCTNATRIDYSPWTYYRVSINWDVYRIPTKIKRKQCQPHVRMNNKDWRVSKFSVEPIGFDKFYWFTLDWDSLYLDENFVVQHNSLVGAYITVCLALGQNTKTYWLPFLGWKKRIWILTKSGSNVKNTIEPYLLWEGSLTRIPPDFVKKVNKDNGVLKSISLNNGTEINILTYDQGSENLQGANPDWIWLDEEPVNEDVVTEIIARTRREDCEMLVTMTPLSGLTRLYEFFFNSKSENLTSKSRVYLVSSLDNPFIDKTWAEGLTEDEYRLRVLGSFESPTWLVYSSFHRTRNVIPHIEPITLGDWLRYYRGLDFGVSHPTGVVFLVQDLDDNLYVYDEVYKSNTLLEDLANEIKNKSKLIDFTLTIRDSASKREGIEIAKYWIKTTPADKFSKGEGDVSNRKSGIMLLNQMFKDWKLMISERCKHLIKELETHYYKEGGKKDWEVNKINDDLLDAMRYVLFTIRKNQKKTMTYEQQQMKKAEAKVYKKDFWLNKGANKKNSFNNF